MDAEDKVTLAAIIGVVLMVLTGVVSITVYFICKGNG